MLFRSEGEQHVVRHRVLTRIKGIWNTDRHVDFVCPFGGDETSTVFPSRTKIYRDEHCPTVKGNLLIGETEYVSTGGS